MRKLMCFAALLGAVLAAHPARAQAPADSLPYVTSIRTIPAQPCDSIPTLLVIEGVFPTQCGRELDHDDDNFTLYVSDPFHSCVECIPPQRAWADSIELGLLAAGRHAVFLSMGVVNFCSTPPDTQRFHQRFEFEVFPDCQPQPPPNDPMAYIYAVSITSERPSFPYVCEGDSVRVRLGGLFPNGCYFVRSITHTPMRGVPPGPNDIQIVFDNACCAFRLCAPGPQPWEAEIMLPPTAPGLQNLRVTAVEVCCRDSILPTDPIGSGTWPFHVVSAESCGVAPPVTCLYPKWLHGQTERCDAFIDSLGQAGVTLMIGNSVPLAGIQGKVHSSGGWPLRVVSMEPVGVAAGMRIAWEHIPGGAKFVMFAESGAPIPANFGRRESQVLRITWTMTPMPAIYPAPEPEDPYIISTSDLFGSDIDGGLVPMCPMDILDIAKICVGGGACDLNFDRHSDVRDLVLMAHCLGNIGPCPPDPARALDCDGDLGFDFDDLVCCTRHVLGVPPCPGCGDSVRVEPGIALEFGSPSKTGTGFDVPVKIHGRSLFGAARLTFSVPAPLLNGARFVIDDATWLPVSLVKDGKLEVGLVQLPTIDLMVRPPYVEGILRLEVPSGAEANGAIALAQADLSGQDGVQLAVDFGSPVVRLGAGLGVSLSPARPNPFSSSTAFRLTIDAAVEAADLAVYDLTGRRISTIHKGPLAIGSHAFTWNGRVDGGGKARAGVYFVRATAGSQTTNQKLVMLKD